MPSRELTIEEWAKRLAHHANAGDKAILVTPDEFRQLLALDVERLDYLLLAFVRAENRGREMKVVVDKPALDTVRLAFTFDEENPFP